MTLKENWNRFTRKYLQDPLDDIVFKSRPQKYGAYELRFFSNKNLLIGVVCATSFFVLSILGSYTYLYIWCEPEEEYEFAEFVAFDANVTNFTLPKGDPNADKTKLTKKKAEGAKVKKTASKSKNNEPDVSNKNEVIPKDTTAKGKTEKPDSDKDSTAGKSKDNKNPADSTSAGKGTGKDSTDFGGKDGDRADFIGGLDQFAIYVSKHVVYPPQLKNTKIGGTIFVVFEIDTNGVVDTARVIKGLNAYLDAEAVRVIKASPKWKPAVDAIKRRQRFRIGVKINPPIGM